MNKTEKKEYAAYLVKSIWDNGWGEAFESEDPDDLEAVLGDGFADTLKDFEIVSDEVQGFVSRLLDRHPRG